MKVGNSPNILIKDGGWVLHRSVSKGRQMLGNEVSFGASRALDGCESLEAEGSRCER